MNNLYFPICAVLINILIVVVFFSKKRIHSDETRAYSNLIIIALLESSLACLLVVLMNLYGIPKYIYNIHRIDYILILFWVWALFNYVLIVSIYNNKKLRGLIQKSTFIVNILVSICFFFLNVNVINKDGIIDTNGGAMNLLVSMLGIYVILILLLVFKSLIKNIKSSNNKKFIPLFFLALLGILSLVIRRFAPEILLISLVAAYADLIMFFTIENPDVKMIYELNRNKKLLESMSEEKSNFLFSMTQDTKKPIDNILEVSKILLDDKNKEDMKTGIKVIENNARGLKNIINNVLDISNISSSKLAVSNETYNAISLLNECIKKIEKDVNKNVTIETEISKNIPDELYGDSVKLKQVIMSILINASKYTKEGYIKVSANEIVKYDVCRLIIEIEDTDLLKLNSLDVDLKLAFKIIRKLGGFINIRSEKEKGSTFTIILDQKIKVSKDYYSEYIFNKKKVMVVSDKLQTLKDINTLANKYDIELLTTMHSSDIIERVKDGESFDLILLEDDMKPISGFGTLGKLQEAKEGFNVPTVIMLNKNKESIKDHYVEDGFSNYIRKQNLEEDFDKVIKKYI